MKNNFLLVLISSLLVYFIGININVMDIDASQYAEMSREMSITNSFLQVFELGKDYLDKPPFLFWASALSIKIFGANNFGYRLPSLLFGLFTLYGTYKFAYLYYKKEIALLATLVLATSQAFFLTMHDVRTDTILMSWVICSIWQLALWFKNKNFINLAFGCVAIGAGMLTKGPIALILPVLSFGSHFLVTKNLRVLFKWQHLVGLIIIALILLPMSVGLYQQFDMQPNKIVNNNTGVSGLRFFYWTQSFGRITGESVWNNNANIFFLAQNMLWAFLPFTIVFFVAFFLEIKKIILSKFSVSENEEWICVGGFLLTYLALGSSKYQLPHYIFVVLPFAAIITAKFLYSLNYEKVYPKFLIFLQKFHFVLFLLLQLFLGVVLFYCFTSALISKILFIIFIACYLLFFLRRGISQYFLKLCFFSFIGINFFLNSSIYPSLLKYQAGSTIGEYLALNKIPNKNTFIYQNHIWHSLHFYNKAIVLHKDSALMYQSGDFAILPSEKIIDFINYKIEFDILFRAETYPVSRLKWAFLNPKTRKLNTLPYAIIKIK